MAEKVKNCPNERTRHHRKPRALGGGNDPRNISLVSRKKHQSFHTLFGSMTVQAIARELNQVWLDREFVLVPVKRSAIKEV